MLKKLAIKIGLGKLLDYIRACHEGKNGPEAKGVVDGLMEHAAIIGIVLGAAVLGLTMLYGPDSDAVLMFGGFATSVLLPAGLLPAAWQKPPEELKALWWHKLASNSSDVIALAILGAWDWTFNACPAAGGWHVLGLAIPCGACTWAVAMAAGAVLQLGILSDLKLARPPKPAKKG